MTIIPGILGSSVKKTNTLNDRWAVASLGILAVLLFSPALASGFVLIDDHELLRFASGIQLGTPLELIPAFIRDYLLHDVSIGRVRPLFYVLRVVLAWVLGANPLAWHLVIWAMGVVTALLLYASFRISRLSIIVSLLFAGSVFFSANVSLTWIMLGTGETPGVLLTAVALFSLAQAVYRGDSRKWDIFLVLAALAAGLCKETFVLIVPALLYARIVLWKITYQRSFGQALRANLSIVLCLAIVFFSLVSLDVVVAKIAGAQSYGGSSLVLRGDYLLRLASVGFNAWWQGGFLLPVFLMLWSSRRSRWTSSQIGLAFHTSTFCALWILPQLLIYSTRDAMVGFHWLPAIIGINIANALALAWLAREDGRLYKIGIAWIALCIVLFSGVTYVRASRFHADAVALNQMLDYLVQNVSHGRTVVIATEPVRNLENTVSMPVHIAWRGRNDILISLLVVRDPSYPSTVSDVLASGLEQHFAGHNALTDTQLSQVDAIILFTPEETLPPAWYAEYKPSARLIEFSELAFYPTMDKGALRVLTPMSYKILWVGSAR